MQSPVESLSFMAGSWSMQRGTGTFHEVWMPPSGGLMLGMSRTVRGGKATFEEHLRIDEHEGRLRLMILGRFGEKPITLLAEGAHADRVVFKPVDDPNQATISYWKDGAQLKATVEGSRDGKPYKLEFVFDPVAP